MQNFSLNTCKQTFGWMGGWVNDRPYPKHRAAFSGMRAKKIDDLLYKCVKENMESFNNTQHNMTQINPALLPLNSEAINSITFNGMSDAMKL